MISFTLDLKYYVITLKGSIFDDAGDEDKGELFSSQFQDWLTFNSLN